MQRDIGEKVPNGINGTNGVHSHTDEAPEELDALIIGGGFSGCYLIHASA